MNPVEIIEKKRDGKALSADEINFFINGYLQGNIPDYQVSALLMGIYFQNMNTEEIHSLTHTMLSSSTDHIDLSKIEGPKISKHSTGGVGDKLSLILAPLLASLGVTIFKMSGRGLGHTGGTLDKLESIPSFQISWDNSQILSSLKKVGALIVAAGDNICPADKKLYALRDVTATVDSLPLIVSSIMSKKLSEDFDGLVLDVKVGSGAFLKTLNDAHELANALVKVGSQNGKKVTAVMTDMNWPLGNCVGNAIEVNECVNFMKSPVFDGRLYEAIELIGGEMYQMAEKCDNIRSIFQNALQSGRVYEKFLQMVAIQNGDVTAIEKGLPLAPVYRELVASKSGHIQSLDAARVGVLLNEMGGGRKKIEDVIDHGVGIEFCVQMGDKVDAGSTIAKIWTRHEKDGERALRYLEKSIRTGEEAMERPPLFQGKIS